MILLTTVRGICHQCHRSAPRPADPSSVAPSACPGRFPVAGRCGPGAGPWTLGDRVLGTV
jgi:hypothetical protein